ncbi:unnamed protein product [Rotaria sp. Silwood2]|nr:unnamed protein product [Rotaria sp. Silwood2]
MLSSTATLLMGNQLVSIDVLRQILSSSTKLFHGLISSDLNPRDHQNYASCIKNQHEQVTSPILRFPVRHKNKHDYLSSGQTPRMKLPTQVEIEQTVVRAFDKATNYLEQVGVMTVLSKNKLYDIVGLNNYARVLFEDKQILDIFSQENADDDDDDWEVYGSEADNENDDDDVISILRYHDDPDSLQPTFRTIRVCDNVPSHLLQSYFKVRINDKDKLIHKSTACWILTEQNRKLSADRTQRVTQAK